MRILVSRKRSTPGKGSPKRVMTRHYLTMLSLPFPSTPGANRFQPSPTVRRPRLARAQTLRMEPALPVFGSCPSGPRPQHGPQMRHQRQFRMLLRWTQTIPTWLRRSTRELSRCALLQHQPLRLRSATLEWVADRITKTTPRQPYSLRVSALRCRSLLEGRLRRRR